MTSNPNNPGSEHGVNTEPPKEIPNIEAPSIAKVVAFCSTVKKTSEPARLRDLLWKNSIGITKEALENTTILTKITEKLADSVAFTLDDIRALAPTIAELVAFRAVESKEVPERISTHIDALVAKMRKTTEPEPFVPAPTEPAPALEKPVVLPEPPSPAAAPTETASASVEVPNQEPPAPAESVVEAATTALTGTDTALEPAAKKPVAKKRGKVIASAFPDMLSVEKHKQMADLFAPEMYDDHIKRIPERTAWALDTYADCLKHAEELEERINQLPNPAAFRRNYRSKIDELNGKIYALKNTFDRQITAKQITEIQDLGTELEKAVFALQKDSEGEKIEDDLHKKIRRLKNADLVYEKFQTDLATLSALISELRPNQEQSVRKPILEKVNAAVEIIRKKIELLPRLEPVNKAKKTLSNSLTRLRSKRAFQEAYAKDLSALEEGENELYSNILGEALQARTEELVDKIKKITEQVENAHAFEAIMDQFFEDASGLKNFLWKNKWGLTQEWFDTRRAKHESEGSSRYAYMEARLRIAKVTPERFREFLPSQEEIDESNKAGRPLFKIVKRQANRNESVQDRRRNKHSIDYGQADKKLIEKYNEVAREEIKQWWPKIGASLDEEKEDKVRKLRRTLWTSRLKPGQKPIDTPVVAGEKGTLKLRTSRVEPGQKPYNPDGGIQAFKVSTPEQPDDFQPYPTTTRRTKSDKRKLEIQTPDILSESDWDAEELETQHDLDKMFAEAESEQANWKREAAKKYAEATKKELGENLSFRLDNLIALYKANSDVGRFRAAVLAAANEKPSPIIPLNRDGSAVALGFKKGPPALEYLRKVLGSQYDDFVSKLPSWAEYNRGPKPSEKHSQEFPPQEPPKTE